MNIIHNPFFHLLLPDIDCCSFELIIYVQTYIRYSSQILTRVRGAFIFLSCMMEITNDNYYIKDK